MFKYLAVVYWFRKRTGYHWSACFSFAKTIIQADQELTAECSAQDLVDSELSYWTE